MSSETAIAVAAMAAVSARRIVRPREAEIHPDFRKAAIRPRSIRLRDRSRERFRGAGWEASTSRSRKCCVRTLPGQSAELRGSELTASCSLIGEAISGGAGAAGLLGRLERDSAPALNAFRRCRSQMRVGTASDHRHNSGDSQFSAFLDRPFHAIELEDGEQQE